MDNIKYCITFNEPGSTADFFKSKIVKKISITVSITFYY